MTDPAGSHNPPRAPALTTALAPELEARIAAFENALPTYGFDAASWFWMMLLGVVIPLALAIVGWWA